MNLSDISLVGWFLIAYTIGVVGALAWGMLA